MSIPTTVAIRSQWFSPAKIPVLLAQGAEGIAVTPSDQDTAAQSH